MQRPHSKAAIPRRRGANAYLIASITAQLCALLRYTILARLLGPEQLGLAATLIVTAQFFDSVTDSGSDRFLIQDAEGDTPTVQRLVQLVFVGRGLVSAVGLILVAGPIAAFYKAPPLVWGLILLALSPLISGLLHLDMRRLQRHNDFRAESLGVLISEFANLAVSALAAWFTRDFTAVAYGLIVRSIVMVVVSHLRRQRPYELGYAREQARRLARFGAPLILNGLLLFMGTQADRILVANRLGLAELGRYSAVILLIYYPTGSLTRFLFSIHLPRISAHRDDPPGRERAADALGSQTLLLAISMVTGFAIVAPPMIVLLYGARFTQPALTVAMIGILQSLRFMRPWPVTVAMSQGKTGIVLADNCARLVGLPAAFAGVVWIGGLQGLTLGLMLGEILALTTAISLLNRSAGDKPWRNFDRVAMFLLLSVAVVGWATTLETRNLVAVSLLGCGSILLVAWIASREAPTIVEAVRAARRVILRR